VRDPLRRDARHGSRNWKKEATVHHTLTERNNGRFTLAFDGRADETLAAHALSALEADFPARWPRDWRLSSNHILVTLLHRSKSATSRARQSGRTVSSTEDSACPSGAAQNLEEFDRILAARATHAMIYGLAQQGMSRPEVPGLARQRPRGSALVLRRQSPWASGR